MMQLSQRAFRTSSYQSHLHHERSISCCEAEWSALSLKSKPEISGGLVNFLFRNRAYSCCGDLYAEYEKLEKLGQMGDVREYTTAEITRFLKRIGFVVDKLIFRGGYRSRKAHVATLIFAALRPFVSYVARKPAQL
jgi:hypothetical protein